VAWKIKQNSKFVNVHTGCKILPLNLVQIGSKFGSLDKKSVKKSL